MYNMHNDTTNSSMNLFLASKYADKYVKGNEAHSIFNIRNPIIPDPDTRILACITDLELPYSFYVIRNSNNHLRIQINGGATVNFTLTVGNYNINQLVDAFNDNGGTLYANNITTTYDANTNKLSFSHNSTTIKVVIANTTMLKEIGWKTTQDTYASPITGENMVNLSGLANIYLRSKNLGVENYDSNNAVSGTLCKIPVNVLPLEFIFYRPVENLYIRLSDRQITNVDVAIEDEAGNILNLNGGEFSFTMSLHFQYQRDKKVVEDTLQYQIPTYYSNLDYVKKDEEKNNVEDI